MIPPRIRILVVEDSPMVRYGIKAAIESEPAGRQIEIVGEVGTAAAAVPKAQRLRPDVVLLDLHLPDGDGLAVCRELREQLPKMGVLVLTSATDNQTIYESVVAGAHGYLLKDIDPAGLIQAVIDCHAGRPVFSGHVASRVLEIIRSRHGQQDVPAGHGELSPQEKRVLAGIGSGHSNKEIARQLDLSLNTVKNYIANIFQKLHIKRRSQAVALYLKQRDHRPQ